MKELMPNETALTSSSTEGSIQWSEKDAYVIVMGKPKHSGHVRGVLRALPHKSSSCLTMSSPHSQVPALLGEIDELKGLLMAQQ